MTDFDIQKRLDEVARQPNGGPNAAETLRSWIDHGQPFVDKHELRHFAAYAPTDLIVDSFRCLMPFGTGGRRGRVGIGPNRLNQRTLALTVAGHSEYLRKTNDRVQLTVVIANDNRVFGDITASHQFMGDKWSLLGTTSRALANLASQIYATYGIEAYITSPADIDAYMPTPELSFAIRQMSADGGLNVSASHNHPDDNGLKVFTRTGGQYCPPDDDDLAETVQKVSINANIESSIIEFRDRAREIPPNIHTSYIDLYVKRDLELCSTSSDIRSKIPIVYTPLCGTGLVSVGEVLGLAGYNYYTPLDQYPDGSFSGVPMRSPNPEIPGVTDPATEYASSVGADLVLSTDPDADRLGVELRLPNGAWKHLTGNQIAAILAYFLVADKEGPELSGSIVSTVATSKILGKIGALGSGVSTISDLMIGFKFIGQHLDSEGNVNSSGATSLVLAAEESHGYLTTASLRDKDAASAAYLIAHLNAQSRRSGRTLWDYLMRVYEKTGIYIEVGRSLVLPGADGAETIKTLMSSLRADPITQLGEEPIIARNDYWLSSYPAGTMTAGERASRNIIEMASKHYRLVVRPSGTEAKLKYYLEYHEPVAAPGRVGERYESMELAVCAVSSALYADMAQRAGYPLSAEALQLPDVMTLEEKAGRK